MLHDQGSFRSIFSRGFAFAVLLLAMAHAVWAQAPAEPPALASAEPAKAAEASKPAEEPTEVAIGVLLNRIEEFSIKDNRFLLNFYVWFRWKGDLKPFETMEVVNGHIESKDFSDAHDLDGGLHYACYLVRATINQEFDLARYPLEKHVLRLEIEDGAEVSRVVYVADDVNSTLGTDFRVAGFKAQGAAFRVVPNHYRTNYGDLSIPTGNESTFSRFIATIDIQRTGGQYAFKLFISLYIATFIALLAMWVAPDFIDPRLGLGVAAVFAAVGSQFVIASNLPETDQVTLADKTGMITIFFVFLTLAETIVVYVLAKRGREAAAIRVDRVSFFAFLGLYAIANWMIAL